MARGMHRHRRIRLDNLRQTKIETRTGSAPGKARARKRRDARIIAKIRATKAGTGYAPEVQSWLSARVGKAFSRISADEIASAIA
jgi:hypothetical protein